jgi:hypothetical protein
VDKKRISALAASSFRHRNGFVRLVLGHGDDCAPKLRLHVWTGSRGRCQIHSHSWNFASKVLRGVLQAKEFRVARATTGTHGVSVVPNKSSSLAGNQAYIEDSPVFVRTVGNRRYHPGEVYALQAGAYHTVQALEASSVTLVIQGRHLRSDSKVLFESGPVPTGTVNPLATQVYLQCLFEAQRLLRAGDGGLGDRFVASDPGGPAALGCQTTFDGPESVF